MRFKNKKTGKWVITISLPLEFLDGKICYDEEELEMEI